MCRPLSLRGLCEMTGRVAVVYDFLQVVGGAEMFSLELAKRLPHSRLIVAGVARSFPRHLLPNNLTVLDTRSLPETPARRALHAMRAFRQSRCFMDQFDQVILSGHYSPLLRRPAQGQKWVYYAHTTPLPFIHEDYRRTVAGTSLVRRSAQIMVGKLLARHFRRVLKADTMIIANSAFTAKAITSRLGLNAEVLHPPGNFQRAARNASKGYFLSFARQEPGKRVHRIIEAFQKRPAEHLIIASTGSQNSRLRNLAIDNEQIEFHETTDSGRIRELLANCRASIYIPVDEPFGISAVESLAFGKPVIAARSGGLPEIVTPGTNGWLIDEDADVASLLEAIDLASESECARMQDECIATGRHYTWDRFMKRFAVLANL